MVATTVRRISAQVHLRGVIDVVLLEDLRTIASTEGAPERRIRASAGHTFAVTCVKEEARVRCLGCVCWLDEKQGVTVSVSARDRILDGPTGALQIDQMEQATTGGPHLGPNEIKSGKLTARSGR